MKWIQAQLQKHITESNSKMHIAPIVYMGYHHTTQYHNIRMVAYY